MTVPHYELAKVYQIHNNKTGERIEVGEDRDCLGLTEIRSYTDDGEVNQCVVLTQEQLSFVMDALRLRLSDLAAQEA